MGFGYSRCYAKSGGTVVWHGRFGWYTMGSTGTGLSTMASLHQRAPLNFARVNDPLGILSNRFGGGSALLGTCIAAQLPASYPYTKQRKSAYRKPSVTLKQRHLMLNRLSLSFAIAIRMSMRVSNLIMRNAKLPRTFAKRQRENAAALVAMSRKSD